MYVLLFLIETLQALNTGSSKKGMDIPSFVKAACVVNVVNGDTCLFL